MKRLVGTALLLLTAGAAIAQDEIIDPAAAVKQLYMMTPRSSKTDASFGIWADGTVNFSVTYGEGRFDRKTIYGTGSTPREALDDLARKAEALSKQLVPQAERDKSAVLVISEGVKSILYNKRPSQ